MNVTIRPFEEHDYPALATIRNLALPEMPVTVEELRHWDAHRDPRCRFARWLAEVDQQVVASGIYDQHSDMYHPHKYFISIVVHPEYQGRGVGSRMYGQITAALKPFEPIALRSFAREDRVRALRFLQTRGFVEEMRDWESRLDVAAFDFAPYADAEPRVLAQGITIRTLAELASDPDRNRKLYELDIELSQDVPQPEAYTAPSYELFEQHVFASPRLLPEAYFIAVDNGEYVGSSALWRNQGSPDLITGLTGVKRSYRRRGIALALKLRAIAYAKAQSVAVIKTWNATTNRPMLSINERLGFQKQPASINFVNILQPEEAV